MLSTKHGKMLPNVSTTLVQKLLTHVSQAMLALKSRLPHLYAQLAQRATKKLKINQLVVQNVCQPTKFQACVTSKTSAPKPSKWLTRILNVLQTNNINILVALVCVNRQYQLYLEIRSLHRHVNVVNPSASLNITSPCHVTTDINSLLTSTSSQNVNVRSKHAVLRMIPLKLK